MLLETFRRVSADWSRGGSPKNISTGDLLSAAIRASRSANLALRIFVSGRCTPPRARMADTLLGLRGLLRDIAAEIKNGGRCQQGKLLTAPPCGIMGA